MEAAGLEIAVIGMAGRFPGARDIEEFRQNLRNGVESISFFSEAELIEEGIEPELVKHPDYVKARGIIENTEYFDSSFFGYSPRDADIMDPQTRLFLECSQEALENAGYAPGTNAADRLIGVFTGAADSFFWRARLVLGDDGYGDHFLRSLLNNKEFMSLLVSYKLGLKGPSLMVFSACSTSLAAIHTACQSLLNGECDMALAGGVRISIPTKNGYMYQKGMIFSPDGHCRAFDAQAGGTVSGSGAGVVILKRLADAEADRDHIYAVVKGSALNNDGIRKVGFTAPSIEGQAEAIRTAMLMAQVEPDSISYVEAHGTATKLGDPAEIEGLKLAFDTPKKGFCAIGSVKTNIGHLDTAAGVAGFIKTVLALKYKEIPPSLHYSKPNPQIDFENSPFYINSSLTPWRTNGSPLRAGVSSFGMGGTNVHVILEAHDDPTHRGLMEQTQATEAGLPCRQSLLLFSAKTETALEKMTANLVQHLKANPAIDPADVAFTLQVGRQFFNHRRMVLCNGIEDAVQKLSDPGNRQVQSFLAGEGNKKIIFLFPGLGAQYVDMARGIYEQEPFFREQLDRCFDILEQLVDANIKEILYTQPDQSLLDRPEISQPAVFIIEYALAKLLIHWGIQPYAMSGYSFGEYTAACLAGVFSLEDALSLIVTRGKEIEKTPPGIMLSVPLTAAELEPLLDPPLYPAIDNGPSCIISGTENAVAVFEEKMKNKKVLCFRLPASRAMHSPLMEPLTLGFGAAFDKIKLNEPQIPYVSNLTGTWIKPGEAVNPGYWVRHVKETVKFAAAIEKLMEEDGTIFIEVGPGRDLTTLLRRHIENKPGRYAMELTRPPSKKIPDMEFLLNRLGRLWLYGAAVDWQAFQATRQASRQASRIPLPTYPFERQKLRSAADILKTGFEMLRRKSLHDKNPNMDQWFYVPLWKQAPPQPVPLSVSVPVSVPVPGSVPEAVTGNTPGKKKPVTKYLLFMDRTGAGKQLAAKLQKAGNRPVIVEAGELYSEEENLHFTVNPGKDEHFERLFAALAKSAILPNRMIHLWSLIYDVDPSSPYEKIDTYLDKCLYSLLYIVQALAKQRIAGDIQLMVVTAALHHITGKEELRPLQAAALGPVKVIPLEYPNIRCRSVDILLPKRPSKENPLYDNLLAEFEQDPKEIIVAYRWEQRWIQEVKPQPLKEKFPYLQRLKEKGVYLITGGFGGMGFAIAQDLAKNFKARLILLGRSPFPPRQEWNRRIHGDSGEDVTVARIRKILELESCGARVIAAGFDVADEEQMRKLITQAEKEFGHINGILHAAGVADYEGVIQKRTRAMTEKITAPKIAGTLVLHRLFKNKPVDFMVLFSTIGNFLYKGKFGQVGYSAANEFLDAFVHYESRRSSSFTVTINWADWREVGMYVEAVHKRHAKDGQEVQADAYRRDALLTHEGVEVFHRVLGSGLNRAVICTQDLIHILEHLDEIGLAEVKKPLAETARQKHQRPSLSSEYAAPSTPVEEELTQLWAKFFGIETLGIHDDFFELGGDSLKAITIVAHIEKMGYPLSLNDILSNPTVHGLAALIETDRKKTARGLPVNAEYPGSKDEYGHDPDQGPDQGPNQDPDQDPENRPVLPELVEKLSPGPRRHEKNIFIIHAMHGMINQYKELAHLLGRHYNIYGIQAAGLKPGATQDETPRSIVKNYLEKIRQVQPQGPYLLAGYCIGNVIAYEIAGQLEVLNQTVENLIMIDAHPFFSHAYAKRMDKLEKFPAAVKRFIISRNEKRFKRAKLKQQKNRSRQGHDGTANPVQQALPTGENSDREVLEHLQLIADHMLPLEIVNAPLLVPLAATSRLPAGAGNRFSIMTRSKPVIVKIPGDHNSILEIPGVENLARVIKENL